MNDLITLSLVIIAAFLTGMASGAWFYYRGTKKMSPLPQNPLKSALNLFNKDDSNMTDDEFERQRERKVHA